MAWIKRNLFFVIGAVVALALLGMAGYYFWRGWNHYAAEHEKLNAQYEELKRLNNLPQHPGDGKKVDNIKVARKQKEEIGRVLANATNYFKSIPAIPSPKDAANVTSVEFQAALRRTIDQLSREATNASVALPSEYKFSFFQQFRLLNFAPGSLDPLAVQLGEVKTLTDVLIQAKVNSIDSIQRERVSSDDLTGPQTEYVDLPSQTNDLAVLTPYQITFHSFSTELAQVLASYASSPHGIIVKSIKVEPTAGVVWEQPWTATGVTAPSYVPSAARSAMDADARESQQLRELLFAQRGIKSAPPAPTVQPLRAATTTGYGGPQAAYNEKQLRVTLLVEVVKLLPGR